MTTTHDGAHETNSQARDISGIGKFQLSLNIFKAVACWLGGAKMKRGRRSRAEF